MFIERKEAVMTHLADSSCEEGAGKVESPVTEDTNTGCSTVARASRKTAQPLDRIWHRTSTPETMIRRTNLTNHAGGHCDQTKV